MKIGEASRRVGVDDHVLRHWHDLGVVVPDRAASGHRLYTEEHIRRIRIVQACQSVGMSLAEIRLVLHAGGIIVNGRRSGESLYDFNLATYDEGDSFDQSAARGFVELHGLSSKIAAKRDLNL